MKKLNILIPSFILHCRLIVERETKEGKRPRSMVYDVDVDGTPVTFLRSVKLLDSRRAARSEPFVINVRGDLEHEAELKLELEFMGHYGEPNLETIHNYDEERDTKTLHLLEYNPQNGEWRASTQS